MPRFLSLGLIAFACALPSLAQDLLVVTEVSTDDVTIEDEDAIVRLPANGEVRSRRDRERLQADKLKLGGGLLASFDTNEDGVVSRADLSAGIESAFADADANGDGELTALEQQAWARSLPTRDNSLANPVRFDPNLDRRVSFEEFSAVISDLWNDYRDDGDDVLKVSALKAPEEKKNRFPNLLDGELTSRAGSTIPQFRR
ncbi:EF-hand domain-containing protein [Henriciella barbarensis]|uniref:EF-hand domain-containing protein n=1 Tax=Henriciella barbarensis TaxID=86342 RepID=A0A399R5D6_9PROT|nr:EF-hand domain-containing protein [Henriciella barbarensis]RIJ25864.1 EF-hand domain-containing protein [Henriciella barbarensis]